MVLAVELSSMLRQDGDRNARRSERGAARRG